MMKQKLTWFILALCAAVLTACGGDHGPDSLPSIGLEIPRTALDYKSGMQFIYVTAEREWHLTLSENWASVDTDSGTGDMKGITLTWGQNDGEENRSCDLTLTSGSQEVVLSLVQLSRKESQIGTAVTMKSDPVPGWLELPAITEQPNCYYVNHDMQIGTRTMRNYSYLLDVKALVSLWVAYPLNKSLIGSGGRTNEWGLDPKVPRNCQSVIYSAYRGGYERGHQLPSADRLSANVSTFYGTNMTPQLGELNEEAWASLEGMVRTWSRQFDTLYVVTGADIKGSTRTALDNDGKSVTVPVGYFKALLGFKKSAGIGITGSTGGYTGIAFYFDHKYYTPSTSAVMKQAMTIDALEAKLGYDFFPNLVPKIGESFAAKVESTNDSWWNSNAN